MEAIYRTHGLPETLRSDNGPQFASKEFEGILEYLGISHKKGVLYWPQSNGEVERGNETIMTGRTGLLLLGEVCRQVAAVLFKIEVTVKLGLTKTSSTSEVCKWNKTFREKINSRSVAEFTDLVKRNRKGNVPSVSYTPSPTFPDLSVLKSLNEVCPRAAFSSLIPKLDPEETDSASEDEDESNIPQPLTALYSEEYASLTKYQLNEKCSQIAKELQVIPEQCKELEKITRNQSAPYTLSTAKEESQQAKHTVK